MDTDAAFMRYFKLKSAGAQFLHELRRADSSRAEEALGLRVACRPEQPDRANTAVRPADCNPFEIFSDLRFHETFAQQAVGKALDE
jgi:hypothetical protein